ncbi:MAG: hypothetical protein AAFR99_14985 [Cyanobacteria bacterium J06629_9]
MPRLNTSAKAQARIVALLNALTQAADLTREAPSSITVTWLDEPTTSLWVSGQLQDLIAFVYDDEPTPRRKDQLRNDLRVLEHIGILQDRRERKQGAKAWQFTLHLQSRTDLDVNAEAVTAAILATKKKHRKKAAG